MARMILELGKKPERHFRSVCIALFGLGEAMVPADFNAQ
jgi:hypothetical protein